MSQKNNLYYNLISKENEDLSDTLLYQYNNFIYSFGDHLKTSNRYSLRRYKTILYFIYSIRFVLFPNKKDKKKLFLSNAYVNLSISGFKGSVQPWLISKNSFVINNRHLSKVIFKIYRELDKKSVKHLLAPFFIKLLMDYRNEFGNLLKHENVSFLMVPNDMSLFENLSLKVCKIHNVPTFVYLHGLPARYNQLDDNRADYLIVWGKGLKENYINAGFSKKKILTLSHPMYSNMFFGELKSSLENVLVISKAMPGAPISSTEHVLVDRGRSLYYVELVRDILKKLGVKSATLRLHPSEDPKFYANNLIDDFYKIDCRDKNTSLSETTLVVGPTSTMLLDSIKYEVNYILFDPIINGKTLDYESSLVSPFDGSSFINLSVTTEDFKKNILNPKDNINQEKLSDFLEIDEADYQKFLNIISV